MKQAQLYKGIREEPRLYTPKMLLDAGVDAGVVATQPLPSVTTILRVINKPAFVPAALAAMERELVSRTDEVYLKAKRGTSGFTTFFADEIKAAKGAWGAKTKKAMDVGTRIHKLCEAYARGEFNESSLTLRLEEEQKEVRNGFDAYLEWTAKTGFVASEVEKVVAGVGYAGTADAIGFLRDGTRVLVDWKSGAGGTIYPEYILQWNAYAATQGIRDGFIVVFNRDTGEPHEYPVKFSEDTFDVFLCALRLWEWMEAHK